MMAKRVIRVYAETSVFGGVFDEEFRDASRTFFEEVRSGRFDLVVSSVVQDELEPAPSQVRRFFESVAGNTNRIRATREAVDLQQAYLDAGILGPKATTDALHVALATVSGCSLIVSWNFGHIVHFDKIPLYNAVNELRGLGRIAIHSPVEVIGQGDEGEEEV